MNQRIQQDVNILSKDISDLDDPLIEVQKEITANMPKESYLSTCTDHMPLAKN